MYITSKWKRTTCIEFLNFYGGASYNIIENLKSMFIAQSANYKKTQNVDVGSHLINTISIH